MLHLFYFTICDITIFTQYDYIFFNVSLQIVPTASSDWLCLVVSVTASPTVLVQRTSVVVLIARRGGVAVCAARCTLTVYRHTCDVMARLTAPTAATKLGVVSFNNNYFNFY